MEPKLSFPFSVLTAPTKDSKDLITRCLQTCGFYNKLSNKAQCLVALIKRITDE